MTNPWTGYFDQYAAEQARERAHRLVRRRELRGKGLCARCENPVTGMHFPAAKDCAGFFGGEFEEGDAICFWCLEAWSTEPEDRQPDGRA
jgi:hypothetical protein